MNRAIVIQGPSDYVDEIKLAWSGFNLIWSTWKGEESKYTGNDLVIYNDYPNETGVQNLALQQKTTIEGIKKAKELGYDRVLKWRSDLIPKNVNEITKHFKKDCLNFLAWHTGLGGYFVDYFMEGETDEMILAWEFSNTNGPFAERIITDNIFAKKFINFNFIANKIDKDNEIYWIKKNVYLSDYKNNEAFTTYVKK